jgi:hypothetical protein
VLTNHKRTEFGVPGKNKTPRRRLAGRVCSHTGCDTVLSVYNQSDDCSLHAMRTRKPPLAL